MTKEIRMTHEEKESDSLIVLIRHSEFIPPRHWSLVIRISFSSHLLQSLNAEHIQALL